MAKTCSKCHVEKPVSEFHKRGDKWQPMCKACKKERSAARYAEKGAHIRHVNANWRNNNPEHMQRCRDAWEAPVKYGTFHRSMSRARQCGAYIGDTEALYKFYAECPEGYEVDHIRPFKHGGAHCVSNLQYLTKSENRRKSSKWEVSDE